jgi:hypothetical protein
MRGSGVNTSQNKNSRSLGLYSSAGISDVKKRAYSKRKDVGAGIVDCLMEREVIMWLHPDRVQPHLPSTCSVEAAILLRLLILQLLLQLVLTAFESGMFTLDSLVLDA